MLALGQSYFTVQIGLEHPSLMYQYLTGGHLPHGVPHVVVQLVGLLRYHPVDVLLANEDDKDPDALKTIMVRSQCFKNYIWQF